MQRESRQRVSNEIPLVGANAMLKSTRARSKTATTTNPATAIKKKPAKAIIKKNKKKVARVKIECITVKINDTHLNTNPLLSGLVGQYAHHPVNQLNGIDLSEVLFLFLG